MTVALAGLLAGCGTEEPSPEQPGLERDRAAAQRRHQHIRELERRVQRVSRERSSKPEASPTSSAQAPPPVIAGQWGATIGAPGSSEPRSFGELTSGSAWSTIKVPIALRVLMDAGGPEAITGEQDAQIRAAITASDNDAAAALFADLGRAHGGVSGAAAAVTDLLRRAGDTETVVSTHGRDGFSPHGQTEWSLEQQHRFMAELAGGCLGHPDSTSYVLDLMGDVTAEPWGMGAAGVPARWKGGWGPGTDGRYLLRQMGEIDAGAGPVIVTLAVIPEDGRFETGQSQATGLAVWLADLATTFNPRADCRA